MANIYLHALDQFVVDQYEGKASPSYRARLAKRGVLIPCSIVRYADDFVVLVRGTRADAEHVKAAVADFLHTTLRMELADEKTLVTPLTQGFDFLGFAIRAIQGKHDGRRKVIMRPSRRSIRRFRDNIRRLFARWGYPSDLHPLFAALNSYLRGWSQYFAAGVSKWTFNALDSWLYRFFARWLLRRHQGHRRYGWRRVLAAYRIPRRLAAGRSNRASREVTLGLPASADGSAPVVLARLSDTPIRYSRLFGPYCPYRPADRQLLRQRRHAHAQPTGVLTPQWLW